MTPRKIEFHPAALEEAEAGAFIREPTHAVEQVAASLSMALPMIIPTRPSRMRGSEKLYRTGVTG